MSTVKTDKILGSMLPLTVSDSAIQLQTFVAGTSQLQYTIPGASFNWNSSIRAFINNVEVTCQWISQSVVQIGTTPASGSKVHIYKVGIDISRVVGRPLINAISDSAASTAGVAVGSLYRNGSVVMVRVS